MRHLIYGRLILAAVLLCLLGLAPTAAWAEDSLTTTNDQIVGRTTGERVKKGTQKLAQPFRKEPPAPGTPAVTYLPKAEYSTQMDVYREKLSAAIAANKAATNARGRCVQSGNGLNCGRFQTTALPADPGIRQAANPGPAAPAAAAAPAAPAITPEQAAYIASARLRLTAPEPTIGPAPEINEWGMAAVGYPLWLWAEGDLDPAPVSDSVFDLAVSLDARLVEVVFDMGDGGRVRCSDVGTRWSRSVEPGAKSPTCGYAYQEPSLPHGSYTVTANAVWAVDWAINGTTGTIPFYQSASTEIPVGELQVLVR